MSREASVSRSTTHGSYVQLNTYDEKEKVFKPEKSALPPVWPYKKCVCTRRDAVLVSCVLGTALVIVALSLGLGLPQVQDKREHYLHPTFIPSSSPLLTFSRVAVAADGQPCAAIAKSVLEEGGSTVDAAIAAIFCAGVVNPQSSGLGGGFTLLFYSRSNNTAMTINAREIGSSSESNGTIALPSELRGLQQAHALFGRLPWRRLLQPSIRLCAEGLAHELTTHAPLREAMSDVTDEVRRSQLANTLERIAEEGADVLYKGNLSQLLLQDIDQCGGGVTSAQLSNYEAMVRPSVQVLLSVNLSILAPPVADGLLLPFVLQILSHYNLSSAHFESDAALQYHRIAEAFKIAFSERSRLLNITQADLMDLSFSSWMKISDTSTLELAGPEVPSGVTSSHVSIVTQEGEAVSITSSLNVHPSQLCFSPSTGLMLSRAASLSLLSPAILTDTNETMAAGATYHSPTTAALGIIRALWLKHDMKESTDAPRIHQQLNPDDLEYEPDFPQIYVEKLLELGHTLKKAPPSTTFRGVLSRGNTLYTNVDYRSTGSADGL